MKSDTIKRDISKTKKIFSENKKIHQYKTNTRQIQVRTPLLILSKHAIEKTEESKTTQQNIDFVTSSEGYRPLQDLNLIDDYKIRN